jgi:hypothetical protein
MRSSQVEDANPAGTLKIVCLLKKVYQFHSLVIKFQSIFIMLSKALAAAFAAASFAHSHDSVHVSAHGKTVPNVGSEPAWVKHFSTGAGGAPEQVS